MSTADLLVRLAREGLWLALLLSAPMLLAALAAGLLAGLLPVQEPTLSFAPRLAAVLLALAVAGPWIGAQLLRFTATLLELLPRLT